MTCAVDEYMEEMTLKHQEDKKAALEQQYEAFERYIHGLTAGGFLLRLFLINLISFFYAYLT